MEKGKSLIFLFFAASFILVMLSIPLHIASAQAEPQLHEPLVFPNNALSTGQETIWSCITFGHYPSAEVIRSGWDSVDSDAAGDPARRFTPTAYALGRGTWQSDNAGSEGNTFWLLRSNGFTASNVVYVGELGHIYNRGIPVTCQDAGLVPAIRIDLETAAYSYTGTVCSRDRVSGN